MILNENYDNPALTFRPRHACFSRVQVAWKGYVLNSCALDSAPLVDLSYDPLTDVLFDLFSPLSFVEVVELRQSLLAIPQLDEAVDWLLFLKKQNQVWSDRLSELSLKIITLDEAFLSWAHDRKLSAQDLMPLNAFSDLSSFNVLAPHFVNQNLTRADGKACIDLLVDLLMMNVEIGRLVPDQQPWIESLKKLRYPMTLERDRQNTLIPTLGPLPKSMSLAQFRQGDRIMHKLQITFSDTRDLRKKLEAVEVSVIK